MLAISSIDNLGIICMIDINYRKIAQDMEFKIRKLSEEHDDVIVGENRLCKLPEGVLQHILSFLGTREVVRTSVLSTRWKYLWTSIPNLEFTDSLEGPSTTMMNFVDRALSLRNVDIKQFALATDLVVDQVRVCWWISALVWRNVQSITIDLQNCRNDLELPHCLFTCASLRKMDLDLPTSYTLKLPSSIRLSNLRTLMLTNITFPDNQSTQKLFSSCPVLEDLCLYECNWKNITAVNICYPKLLTLDIYDIEIDSTKSNEPRGCLISIFGSCLRRFSYSGYLANEYFIHDSSLLYRACIQVEISYRRKSILANRLYKLLNGLRDAEKLSLQSDCIEILDFVPEVLAYLPMFKNLLTLDNFEYPVNLDQGALLKILQNSPCLKTLEFSAGIEVSTDVEVKELFKPIPSCFLSTLERIYVSGFYGNKELCMNVVEMLLDRAAVLQHLVFSYRCQSKWSEEETNDFTDQMRNLPRAIEVLDFKLEQL